MKNLIISFLFFAPYLLMAQEVTVSETIQTREDVAYYLLDDQRGNVILLHDQSTKFKVEGFGKDLRLKWDKELELDRKRPEIVNVTSTGGDFCVFYTFRQKQHLVLKVHRYNPAANLVDSVTIKDFGTLFYKPGLQTTYSEDEKIALIWSIEDQREIYAMAFHMGQMKMLWERSFTSDDFLFSRDFHQMLVDNNGNMFLVLKKDNRRSKQDEHYLEVFECGGGEDAPIRRFTVPMQGHLTYDAYFTFDNLNKSIVAGGLYSDENITRADGIFYLNISHSNSNNQVLRFHPFEKDFVNILIEKNKSKNKGLPEASVQEVVMRRDGGILLIAELNKEFARGGATAGYYARSSVQPIVDYYYDDIFLVSMHPDGEFHWRTILHKKQYSQDDDAVYSSYFLAKTPSALRVIFNDEVKQENTVSEYVIRGNGEYDRNAVMNTERKDLALRFRDAVQVSANEIIVPSERRHRLKLVKVSY